jgi:hypothetical protein
MRVHVFTILTAAAIACGPTSIKSDQLSSDGDDTSSVVETDECDDHPSSIQCIDGVAVHCNTAEDIEMTESCIEAGEVCVDDYGCASCEIEVEIHHAVAESDSAFVGIRPMATSDNIGWEKYHSRPVEISAMDDALTVGSISIDTESTGIQWFDEEWNPIASELTVEASNLPIRIYAHSHALGVASLSAAHSECPETGGTVSLHSGEQPPITGHPLSQTPWAERVQVFNIDETIRVVLNPTRHADRIGASYQATVVRRKTAEEWAADPSLVDVSMDMAETVTVTAGATADNITDVWIGPSVSSAYLKDDYDLVLDFDNNLQLDPGDILMGPGDELPGFSIMGDLSQLGPHATSNVEISGGTWLTQKIYYPTSFDGLGTVPLLIISHGNGHNYAWYDYLGNHLASHGYVVMSHSNHTGPGIETSSTTTLTNTDYFLQNIDSIAGGALDGHVDSSRIAWIGHSRGGEGVVRAYDRIVDEGYETVFFDEDDIAVISSIAPTVFFSVELSDPHDKPYHLFAGAADGDVNGGPACEQCQFFRLSSAAESKTQVTYLQGVGHNEFNCCGFADATGPDLIGRTETQVISKSYYLALARAYLDGDSAWMDFFTRRADVFRPAGIDEEVVIMNSYRPDPTTEAVAIDDFQTEPDESVASSGAIVQITATGVHEALLMDGNNRLRSDTSDPMNGMTQACCEDDLNRGVVLSWDSEASIAWNLSAPMQNITSFEWLSFRIAQGTRHAYTALVDGPLDFTVTLIDGNDVESSIWFGEMGGITKPYARTGLGAGSGWANEFNTIRLRLSDFVVDQPELVLSNIKIVRFDFGTEPGSLWGRIGIDDVLLEY